MAALQKDEAEIAKSKQLNYTPQGEEYEKMISGMLYDSLVPPLEDARFKARAWCHKYNSWFPHDDPNANFRTLAATRLAHLRQIMGYVGDEVFIEPPLTLDYGCNVRLEKGVYANFNLTILDCGLVTVGARTMFGPNVSILAATHETEVESRRKCIEYAKPVVIGEDCWIGGHSVILPGVTIGKGCTVGANSVVTRDVPSWSVVLGSPARVVKKVKEVGEYVEERKEDAFWGNGKQEKMGGGEMVMGGEGRAADAS